MRIVLDLQRRRRSLLGRSVILLSAISLLLQIVLARAQQLDDGPALALNLVSLAALALAIVPALLFVRQSRRRTVSWIMPGALFAIIAAMATTSYADVSVELQALLHPTSGDTAAQTSIVLGPSGHDIRLSGELREGAGAQLDELLEAHPGIKRIHLTSEGGLADEGQALGDVIAAHGLVTFVPDYCVSACTLAFIRGSERIVMKGARLGFHAPYEPGLFGTMVQDDSAVQRAAYVAAGIAPDFVDRALKVPSSDLWEPDLPVLVEAHVVTGAVDRYHFPDSNLDGDPTLEGARTVILRNFPLMKAFETRAPGASDTVAAWYLKAYRRQLSEGAVVDGLHAIIGSAVDVAMAGADDATLAALARFVATAVAGSDNDCVPIGTSADLLRAEIALDRTGPGADATALALLTAALTASPDQWTHTQPIADRTSPDSPAPIAIGLRDGRTACADVRRSYADVLRQPVPTIAAMMRALVQGTARRMAVTVASFKP
jgi:hypothetical protein